MDGTELEISDVVEAKGGLPYPTPAIDMAIRLYATSGRSLKDIAKASGVSYPTLHKYINSGVGEVIIREVKTEMDRRFDALYDRVIDTLEDGLNHAEPQVALASAGLWLRHSKSQKVEVALTAEDVIQKLMRGEEM